MMRERFLFVIDRMEFGGAERQMLKVISHISNRSDVYVTSLYEPHPSILEELHTLGVTYIPQSNGKGASLLSRIFSWPKKVSKIKRILNELKIDKCISFLEWSNVICLIASKRSGVAVIANVRNHLSTQYRSRSLLIYQVARLVLSYFYNKTSVLVCNSYGIKEDLVDNFFIDKSKIKVIQNTYPLELIRNMSLEKTFSEEFLGEYVFCACGRLTEQKRFASLINSFQEFVSKVDVDCTLLIIGSGPLEDELNMLVCSYDADIRLIPHMSNPFPYINAADAFLLHSEFEGFPNVLAEAVLLNKFCISVDCLTGPREILSNNELCEYKTEIVNIKNLKFGLIYPYQPLETNAIDNNLVECLISYIDSNVVCDKSNGSQFDDKYGSTLWLDVICK